MWTTSSSTLVRIHAQAYPWSDCLNGKVVFTRGRALSKLLQEHINTHVRTNSGTSIGYTMRMRGYRIYTTEGEARGRVYSMTPNPNCITGLYQNAEAFPFPIGSSRAVQCN